MNWVMNWVIDLVSKCSGFAGPGRHGREKKEKGEKKERGVKEEISVSDTAAFEGTT